MTIQSSKDFFCIDCKMIVQRKKNKFKVAGDHECKETDSVNSVQSSLKFHTLNKEINKSIDYSINRLIK